MNAETKVEELKQTIATKLGTSEGRSIANAVEQLFFAIVEREEEKRRAPEPTPETKPEQSTTPPAETK